MRILFKPNEYSQQRQREKKRYVYPILLAMYATYLHQEGYDVRWDEPLTNDYNNSGDRIITSESQIDVPFLKLLAADRKFCGGFDPKYQANGNFKYHPGTYIQAASGCEHGKCTFCVENGKPYEIRDYHEVWEEIHRCVSQGFQEIFDDSATFPTGDWLRKFIAYRKNYDWTHQRGSMHRKNYKFCLGCNMRMVDAPYADMKKVGFRMVLFGLESANQETLDRIGKGTTTVDIKYLIAAAKAGLDVHVAVMFGYPWEEERHALNTLNLVHYLLRKGIAKTAQASLYTPPDKITNDKHRKYINKIYDVAWYSDFWWNKARSIKTMEDLKYLWKSVKVALNEDSTI